MAIDKAFDPTVSRIKQTEPRDEALPDDIDIDERSASGDLFVDTLDDGGRMPPPLEGEESIADPSRADADSAQLLENVRDKLSLADSRVRDFVERRPIVALCGAAAAGFLIGRIVTRL